MRVLFLDFETYYDTEVSLKKLTIPEYLAHDKFHITLLTLCIDDSDVYALTDEEEMKRVLTEILTHHDCLIVSHNIKFDAAVLYWRLGIYKPDQLYGCTVQMGLCVLGGKVPDQQLKTLGDYLNVGIKDVEALGYANGKTRADMDADEANGAREYQRFLQYGIDDTDQCRLIFDKLRYGMQVGKMRLINWSTHAFINNPLRIDQAVLTGNARQPDVDALYAKILPAVQCTREGQGVKTLDDLAEVLRSRLKFYALWLALGGEELTDPETGKLDVSKKSMQFAYQAKTQVLKDLRKARLIAANNVEKSRSNKMLGIVPAMKTLTGVETQHVVSLNVSGAKQTHRFSAGGGASGNDQNLSKRSYIRSAIIAPPNHKVIAGDLSAAELRVSMALCGVHRIIDSIVRDDQAIEQGVHLKEDVYTRQASDTLGETVTTDMSNKRLLGKIQMLSLQYGVAWRTYRDTAWLWSGGEVLLGDHEAQSHVARYRQQQYPEVVSTWRRLENVIRTMATPDVRPATVLGFDFLRVEHEKIILPSGAELKYPDLRMNYKGVHGWSFLFHTPLLKSQGYRKRLYPALLLENLAQAMVGEIINEGLVRSLGAGLNVANQVHDELIVVSHEDNAERDAALLRECLMRPLDYWQDLPLRAEVAIADNYADAK